LGILKAAARHNAWLAAGIGEKQQVASEWWRNDGIKLHKPRVHCFHGTSAQA
jgi:hypothetical protein